jgi:hypothetical protein
MFYMNNKRVLDENATCRKFRQAQTEGNRIVERELPFYSETHTRPQFEKALKEKT